MIQANIFTDTIQSKYIGSTTVHHLWHFNRAPELLLATRPGNPISRISLARRNINSLFNAFMQNILLTCISTRLFDFSLALVR